MNNWREDCRKRKEEEICEDGLIGHTSPYKEALMRWKGGIDAKKPLSLGCGATRPLKKLRSERLAGGGLYVYLFTSCQSVSFGNGINQSFDM